MKNFKKIIIFGVISLGVTIYIIYKTLSNNQVEEIEFNNLEINTESPETIQAEEKYIILHVTGEVKNPGIVKIAEGGRIADAIEASGGVTENVNLDKVNLAYVLQDGQKLYIPSIYDEEEKEYIEEDAGQNIIEEFKVKQQSKINLNTATQTELETLTGIGQSTALKIINYRKKNGKFKTIEEIKNVPGIGESKFEEIKEDICV